MRRVVQRAFEGLWGVGFALLGRTSRRTVERWASPGGQRVVVVAPHPDDEVCGCGGTLLLHRRAGDRVQVVYVTDGRRSTALGLEPAAMALYRQGEAIAAAQALGVDEPLWLGLPEGEWSPQELELKLAQLLEATSPQVLYAPSLVDFHPEHLAVARALARVLAARPCMPVVWVRIFELQVPLTPVLTNLVADTSTVRDESRAALATYQSQLGSILRCRRSKRYAARSFAVEHEVESFWQMDQETYVRLHCERPQAGHSHRFRSLRYYAWSDPLAYLVGLGERRRLARTGAAGWREQVPPVCQSDGDEEGIKCTSLW